MNKTFRATKTRLGRLLRTVRREDQGVLTFEWVLLLTLLVIGIVAGLSTVRDAIIDELTDVAEAAVNFDQSFEVAEFTICDITAPGFSFQDTLPTVTRCERATDAPTQTIQGLD